MAAKRVVYLRRPDQAEAEAKTVVAPARTRVKLVSRGKAPASRAVPTKPAPAPTSRLQAAKAVELDAAQRFYSLQITYPDGAVRDVVLDDTPVTMGRDPACSLCLLSANVSRQHARIWLSNAVYFIEDMGSTNGTRVNGQKINRSALHDGDKIAIANVIMRFTEHSLPA